jgi:hypothetical protein
MRPKVMHHSIPRKREKVVGKTISLVVEKSPGLGVPTSKTAEFRRKRLIVFWYKAKGQNNRRQQSLKQYV